jgi:hypothetical protein
MTFFIEDVETAGVKHMTNLLRIVDAYSHYMTEEEKEMMYQADKFLVRIEILQEEEQEEKPAMVFSSYR